MPDDRRTTFEEWSPLLVIPCAGLVAWLIWTGGSHIDFGSWPSVVVGLGIGFASGLPAFVVAWKRSGVMVAPRRSTTAGGLAAGFLGWLLCTPVEDPLLVSGIVLCSYGVGAALAVYTRGREIEFGRIAWTGGVGAAAFGSTLGIYVVGSIFPSAILYFGYGFLTAASLATHIGQIIASDVPQVHPRSSQI